MLCSYSYFQKNASWQVTATFALEALSVQNNDPDYRIVAEAPNRSNVWFMEYLARSELDLLVLIGSTTGAIIH